MNKLKVIVRDDLNMSNGRLFAQVSHVLMKVISTQLMRDNKNNLKISINNSKKIDLWRCSGFDYEIEYLNDKDYYLMVKNTKNSKKTTVTDNGSTYFNNAKTETCSVIFPDWITVNVPHIASNSTIEESEQRQSIILSTKPKRSADKMLREVTFCAIDSILKAMYKNKDGEYEIRKVEEKSLHQWILGSYGKIVLGTEKKEKIIMSIAISELNNIHCSLAKGENNRIICAAFSPSEERLYKKINSDYRCLN